ncbi:MAG: mechanosensitive ion channel family protein [Bdellovibrionales bacterium]
MKYLVLISFLWSGLLFGSPLKPVKTDSPRDTFTSFYEAMSDYKSGVEKGDESLELRYFDAIRTFDREGLGITFTEEKLRIAAMQLREVIDRVIVVDYKLIPDDAGLSRWRLKNTEITVVLKKDGDREGEFLISKDSVRRASQFYERVKELPYLKGSGQGAGFKPQWYENGLPRWLTRSQFLIPNWQLLGILFSIFFGLIVKKIVTVSVDQLKRLTEKTKNTWDDQFIDVSETMLGSIAATLIWILSIRLLGFEGNALLFFDVGLKILLCIQAVKLAYNLVGVLGIYLMNKAKESEFPLDDQLAPLVAKALKIFTVVFGVLIAIQNMGVNVMSVLAGLGLGGLAFALAAKDTAANLFGSIMILVDKPFKVGDWINASGVDGTVEEIGFRSTKIRTFHSSLVSIPNSHLANINIDNMGRRKHRRIKATLGLTYSTTPEQMESFLEGIKNIVRANPATVKEGFMVNFHSYGDFSLNVLLYCFLDVKSWSEELYQRQNIYLEVYRLAEELGLEFAFPTQSLHLESTPSDAKQSTPLSRNELQSKSDDFAEGKALSKAKGQGIFTPEYLDR